MITIRAATGADAPAVARLLGQLGYSVTPAEAAIRLAQLPPATDPVWLATQGDTALGLIALHRGPMLHVAGEAARITVLIVDPTARRQGIAASLLAHASAWAADCAVLELTTGLQREDAHAFYRAQGFTANALRFKLGSA